MAGHSKHTPMNTPMNTPQPATDWSQFNHNSRTQPPRDLLRRTLAFFDWYQQAPGVAVDLGAGGGAGTMEMLRRGWTVHAVDRETKTLNALRDALPAEVQARLFVHTQAYEDFNWPACDLVWAGFSLPFCDAAKWPALLQRLHAALRPGGRFAGDLFGERHAWAGDADVMTFTQPALRDTLASLFEIEAFDVEDGQRISGIGLARWHGFGVAVRKAG
jgi:tellurite methyltransferase